MKPSHCERVNSSHISYPKNTWRGDGPCQVITNLLKGYEEYKATQLLLPIGSTNDHHRHRFKTVIY